MPFDWDKPFTVVGQASDTPPVSDLIPPASALSASDIRVPTEEDYLRARIDLGEATPQEQFQYERYYQPSLGKTALQLGLGTGEVGKGQLRQALGAAIRYPGYTGVLDIIPAYRRARMQFGEDVSQLGRENVAEAEAIGEELGGGTAGRLARQLGATATVSAPAIPAAVLGGLPAAAITAGGIQYGSSLEQFTDTLMARNPGLSRPEAEQRAQIPAAITGAITTTLTRIIPGGTEVVLNRLLSGELTREGLKGLVKQAVKSVAEEIPEEGLDQIGQGFTERLLVNPDKSIQDIANDTLFAMGAAGILAGTTAGGLGTIGKVAETTARPIERGRRLRELQAYRESPERRVELQDLRTEREKQGITESIMAAGQRRTRRVGETYDRTQGREILPIQPQETTPEAGGAVLQPSTGIEAGTPSAVLQVPPLEPEFPLRPGTKGTPWEDQKGYPIRQNPQTGRWERIIEQPTTGEPNAPQERPVTEGNIGEYPNRNAPRETTETGNRNRILGRGPVTEEAQAPNVLTKVAPVTFLQVQEGMPELVWYKLTADITSPDGRVYPAGKNISNGELARFGYVVPESELAKATPAEATVQPGLTSEEIVSLAVDTGPSVAPTFDINAVVNAFRQKYPNAPRVNVVATESELPPAIRSTKPPGAPFITAVWHGLPDGSSGQVWLVADRMSSPEKVNRILAHEIVGHHGLRTLMGDDFSAIYRAVEHRFRGSPIWQNVVNIYGQNPDVIGQELLADLAETPDKDLNLWQQIVAAIQRWWRENINPNRAISDLEIRRALMRSRRFLQQQPAVEYREFTPEGDLITAYAGEEQVAAPTNPALVEKIDKFPDALCFNNARKWAMENETTDTLVVHGYVNSIEGKRINHAWVEQGNVVIDPTAGIRTTKDFYYNEVAAQPLQKYTPEQASINMVRSRNHGPWTPQEVGDRIVWRAESPFDRMRRESGAEPPPELTPEQRAARERNERIRGRRPETLFAVEDEEGKPTNVMGVTDYVLDRPGQTPESEAASRAYAKTIFDEAGIKVVEDPEMDGWRLIYDGEKKNAAGQKLVDLLTRELATQHQAGKPQLAPLINNVRLNFKYGTMDQLFDLPVRLKLYSIAQGEASRRGMELRALAGVPEDITFAAQNIDVELQHIYSDMFGGEQIQAVLEHTKRDTVKALDKKTPLSTKPEMQQEIDKANATRDASTKIPNAAQLADEIFKQPFESFEDLVNALRERLIKDYNLSPQDATKVASKFKDAFAAPFKAQAEKSLQQVRKSIGQIVGSHKGTRDKIQKAISKGIFNNIGIVQQVAKEMGMHVPTEEEIKKIKALAARERQIGSLTDQELEEYKKMGISEEQLQQAKEARLESTTIPRGKIRKQLELLWGRLTKPIPGLDKDAWRGFKQTKRNLAAAINEFMSANLLFKIGFPSRLGISVLSQWLVNTPTRAMGNALVKYNENKAKGEPTTLMRDMAMHLADSFKAQYNALIPALSSAKAALLGRGEARNIDRLMSGMNTMERLTAKAKEYYDQGDYGRASILYLLGSIKMGYRVAQAMDNLQGVPAEYQEMRARVINGLMGQGMSRGEALARTDSVIGDMKQQHAEALADTKKNWEAAGITGTANELSDQAWNLVKLKQYQRIKELGLPADEFREQIKYYRNVLAWNEAEHKGIGGGIAKFLQRVEQVAEAKGFPTAFTRFSNAIGITINRALAFTPFYKQADYGGYGTSGWFKTEADRQQRRVEAFLGTTLGTAAFMLALSGAWLVRRKWPKDKEEQDLWQQEGHRPGTVEIPVGDGSSFIPISLNNSPLMALAPYLAAGGALHDLLVEREAQQKKLDEEAAKTGAVPGKIRPMSFGDMALVAIEGAKQAIVGGRTPAATLASFTYYGLPNAKKIAAGYIAPAVPGLPALQEVSRMAGVALDERFATLGDFLLPLPGSESRRLNMLGDPVKTPNDTQRIFQIMTGGNYPIPVDTSEAKAKPAYDALFASGYRPPSINPAKGYQIGGQYRPMNNSELDRYIELRGKYFKEGLVGAGPYIGKANAQRVYNEANSRALSEIGVNQPILTVGTTTRGTTTTQRPTGPRRLRSISRLRRPRLRRLSYRRPRLALRRPRLRRMRRLAA